MSPDCECKHAAASHHERQGSLGLLFPCSECHCEDYSHKLAPEHTRGFIQSVSVQPAIFRLAEENERLRELLRSALSAITAHPTTAKFYAPVIEDIKAALAGREPRPMPCVKCDEPVTAPGMNYCKEHEPSAHLERARHDICPQCAGWSFGPHKCQP